MKTIHEQIKESKFIIYRDEEILIVLDFDPISKGHALIIPQKPYLDIDEIPENTLKEIFNAAQVYIKMIKSKFSIKGYSIMQNGGEFNDIDVFHLHVFPRFKAEEFGYECSSDLEEVDVEQLRNAMELELKK